MIFRRAHVHIGTEKTGSTTIQAFLAQNRHELPAQGFHYPRSFGLPNQVGLTIYARDAAVIDDLPKRRGLATQEEVERHQAALAEDFAREVAPLDGKGLDLLLSSEHLHSRITSVEEVQRLHDLLAQFCDELRIVVYLRRQDRVAVSLLSTRLKVGGLGFRHVFLKPTERQEIYYNYAELLERYAKVFGRANLRVRLFEPRRFVNGDLIDDYSTTVGLPVTAPLERPGTQNESLDLFGQRLLAAMNRHLPLFIDDRINPLRQDIGEVIERLYPGRGTAATRAEAQEFLGRYLEGNRAVKAAHFPDLPGEDLFDPGFEMYPEEPPPDPGNFAMAAEAAARLWSVLGQREIELEAALRGVTGGLQRMAALLTGDGVPREARLALLGEIGGAMLAAGSHAEALAVARDGLAIEPKSAAFALLAGKALLARGDAARAAPFLSASLVRDPENAEARQLLATCGGAPEPVAQQEAEAAAT